MAGDSARAHPFYRVLRGLGDDATDNFSLNAAARLAEEFAYIGRNNPRSRKRRSFADRRQAEYGANTDHLRAEPEDKPQLEPDTSVEGVRRELHISPLDPIEELRRIRKRFAIANHPDRLPAQRRGAAEQRMKIANSIIDAEIERRRAATS